MDDVWICPACHMEVGPASRWTDESGAERCLICFGDLEPLT